MSIGTGAVLFVIGAILAFAVNVDTNGIANLNTIGWILMIAGIVVFVVGIVLFTMRRRSVTESHTAVDPAAGERVTQRSTDTTL